MLIMSIQTNEKGKKEQVTNSFKQLSADCWALFKSAYLKCLSVCLKLELQYLIPFNLPFLLSHSA